MNCYRKRIADLERSLADAIEDGIRQTSDPRERGMLQAKLERLLGTNKNQGAQAFNKESFEAKFDRFQEDHSNIYETQQQQQLQRGVSAVERSKLVRPSGCAIGLFSSSDR